MVDMPFVIIRFMRQAHGLVHIPAAGHEHGLEPRRAPPTGPVRVLPLPPY